MQKRMQKITIGIIVAVITITLIGTSFGAVFTPSQSPQGTANTETIEAEYEKRKEITVKLEESLEQNPHKTDLKLALADAYFEKANLSRQLDYQEFNQDLTRAIELYQAYLNETETSEDKYIEVSLRLANAAFFMEDQELAEEKYSEILTKDPDNFDALYGYGLFLFYSKEDYENAIYQWQLALSNTEDKAIKEQLQQIIKTAQDALASEKDKKVE